MFSIVLGMKKGMKQQIKRSSKAMVRLQSLVPEIHFLMCQISRALRSSKRVMLCVNAVMTLMAKKVCNLYIITKCIVMFILYHIMLYIMFLYIPFVLLTFI